MINPFPDNIRKIAIIALSHQQPDQTIIPSFLRTFESLGLEIALFPSCYIDDDLFRKSHAEYPSAPIETRIDDIYSCWQDDSIDLVLPLMGGAGLAELFPFLDWTRLQKRKLPVLGYSNISSMHLAMLTMGVGTPIASPNAFGLAQAIERDDALTCTSLKHSLDFSKSADGFSISSQPKNRQVKVLKTGSVTAPIVAATLSLLGELIGTEYCPDLTDRILMFEQPKMSDQLLLERIFIQLRNAKILENCAGLILGDFRGNGHPIWREKLFQKFCQFVPGPVLLDFPYGHDIEDSMSCLRIGEMAKIDDDNVVVNLPRRIDAW